MPSIHLRYLPVVVAALIVGVQSRADTSEQEAIQAQLASALASADYAAKKCPSLAIDQARIETLSKRSGKTVAELKTSEDYIEQRDVLRGMEQGKRGHLICVVLPSAHGGFARGIITEK